MAFQTSDLSVLAYANNFTLWHYATSDDTVNPADYFAPATEMLRVNDLIITTIDTDGTPATVFYIVTSNDGSNVVVTAYT